MKLMLEFNSYEEMMEWCLKRASQSGMQTVEPVKPAPEAVSEPEPEEQTEETTVTVPDDVEEPEEDTGRDYMGEIQKLLAEYREANNEDALTAAKKKMVELGLKKLSAMDVADQPGFLEFLEGLN